MTRKGLVLTPGLGGTDGVSAVSRLVVAALQAPATESPVLLRVLSLAEPRAPGELPPPLRPGRLLGAGGSRWRFGALALREALLPTRATDVVCLHLHLAPAALPLVARGARLATVLCGVEAWKPLRRLERIALRRSGRLLAISQHTARRFREANPAFAERAIHVCHPGLPESEASGARGQGDEAETSAQTQPYALIVGRMSAEERYKGHDLLLEVWPEILRELPAAALVVAGDGDDRPRLEARAATLGLDERVRFLGLVPREELAELYRGCAFLVLPSRDEGFGLVLLEAMRAGRPCIAGTGAEEEVVEDGVTGVVVDPRDAEAVRAAVVRLFREPETRKRMGLAGAERFEREFTEARFRRRLRELLEWP